MLLTNNEMVLWKSDDMNKIFKSRYLTGWFLEGETARLTLDNRDLYYENNNARDKTSSPDTN